jgi:hypothetical protein
MIHGSVRRSPTVLKISRNGPCGERDEKNGERSAESSDDVEADEDREVQADPESRDPSAVPATCGGDQSDEREGEEEKRSTHPSRRLGQSNAML